MMRREWGAYERLRPNYGRIVLVTDGRIRLAEFLAPRPRRAPPYVTRTIAVVGTQPLIQRHSRRIHPVASRRAGSSRGERQHERHQQRSKASPASYHCWRVEFAAGRAENTGCVYHRASTAQGFTADPPVPGAWPSIAEWAASPRSRRDQRRHALSPVRRRLHRPSSRKKCRQRTTVSDGESGDSASTGAAVGGDERSSPGRVAMVGFLEFAALRLRPRFGDSPVTVVDLGCGSGYLPEVLEAAGYRGRYIGIDFRRHRWSDEPTRPSSARLIETDIHKFDRRSCARRPADLLHQPRAHPRRRRSCASLAGRLGPRGAQVHIVPAESALTSTVRTAGGSTAPGASAISPNGTI